MGLEGGEPREVSMLELQQHTKKQSCWMVIHGDVYDVTPFLLDHPGGDDVLLDWAGKDATRGFEDVGHSNDAREEMKKLYVGKILPLTEEEKSKLAESGTKAMSNVTTLEGNKQTLWMTLAKYLFPVVILGVALLIRKYTS
uniref:Cytochrome b5 heme-binding domain-containing protein n=1 Tax=Compsopogon caeruleus TaxID=31354 RepID=A0A7S1TD50_9RHOD|mmetsp:Transcript_18384/g.38460  ORF Transcript_18384/g.38460 Transcript_18384/m.38460 type:complete len:141 (+) Transcript_18384:94-516(+)